MDFPANKMRIYSQRCSFCVAAIVSANTIRNCGQQKDFITVRKCYYSLYKCYQDPCVALLFTYARNSQGRRRWGQLADIPKRGEALRQVGNQVCVVDVKAFVPISLN